MEKLDYPESEREYLRIVHNVLSKETERKSIKYAEVAEKMVESKRIYVEMERELKTLNNHLSDLRCDIADVVNSIEFQYTHCTLPILSKIGKAVMQDHKDIFSLQSRRIANYMPYTEDSK